MKKHFTSDEEIKKEVLQGLKENEGFCPCIVNSKGQEKYKCPCEDFRENVPVGELCHCMLFIKDEN